MNGSDGIKITKTKDGWIARNENDEVITTKAEIDSLLEQEQYLEAMVKLLQVFGCNVSEDDIVDYSENPEGKPDDPYYSHFDGHISFTVDGREVTVYMHLIDDPASWSHGHAFRMRGGGPFEIHMIISKYIGTNRLFHILGHEMVHIDQYISGRYKQWEWTYGPLGAGAYAEMEASEWNLSYCDIVPFFNCESEFNDYLKKAIEAFENRPLDGR